MRLVRPDLTPWRAPRSFLRDQVRLVRSELNGMPAAANGTPGSSTILNGTPHNNMPEISLSSLAVPAVGDEVQVNG